MPAKKKALADERQAAEDLASTAVQPEKAAEDLSRLEGDMDALESDIPPSDAPTMLARIRSDTTLPDTQEFFTSGIVMSKSEWTEVPPKHQDDALNNPFLETQIG